MNRDTISHDLLSFADEHQDRYHSETSSSERKVRGHFGTPTWIAQFMADRFSAIPEGTIRVLDPGAGVGTLSAAICQRTLRLKNPRHLEFELWETDPKLIPLFAQNNGLLPEGVKRGRPSIWRS